MKYISPGSVVRLAFFFLLCYLAFEARGQQVVRGIVVDSAAFSPLPYVNVVVKHRLHGTSTDEKGNFSVMANPHDTLILSLVGYERLELPLIDYEPSVIRMAERRTLLKPVIINDSRLSENLYDGMFDEQNAQLRKRIPFYYSKAKKEKIKVGRWKDESLRVKTYVDVVINNPETKSMLMKAYGLRDDEYYKILEAFNEKHYLVMYYLTAAELTSLLNRFFEAHTVKK
ncbi:MAG: carboxypeptidase-like regulatory domain-containing protein [Bacteroidota bacterium]